VILVFLTRLLFCLFADKVGIRRERNVRRLVESDPHRRKGPGSAISELFDVLDQPEDSRQSTLDEAVSAFNYINGNLFSERMRMPPTVAAIAVDCSALDWAEFRLQSLARCSGVLEAPPPMNRGRPRVELGPTIRASETSASYQPCAWMRSRQKLQPPRQTGETSPSTTVCQPLPFSTLHVAAAFLVIAYQGLLNREWGHHRPFRFRKKEQGCSASTLCRASQPVLWD
jgi:hypothetical protein